MKFVAPAPRPRHAATRRALLLGALSLSGAAAELRRLRSSPRAASQALAVLDAGGAVRKPKTDARTFVYTSFDSGLRAMLVQDPDAKSTGFAVAVEAGSLEDPADFQGLAHFCEHMVFLGSEKYPDQQRFSQVLALHGGNHNAFTSSEETVYYNQIGNDGVEEAMDIFSRFFIDPSFSDEMVYKEIHAVDSEHKKNMPNTQLRLWHLLKSRANPQSPMSQFSTGDLQTLKEIPESHGKSLVQALKSFHKQNYCAKRLHLVIINNMTAAEQLALAHRHFDSIPKATTETCPPRPRYDDRALYSKALGNLGRRFTVGTKGSPEMWVVLPAPPMKDRYKELAQAYLWNALGNFGPGSLKALLLKEDLSQSYSYYADSTVAGSNVFVTFQLTEKGLANTDRVLELFFAYLDVMRKAGVDSKALGSVQQLRQVSFDYQEKKSSEYDAASSIASSLTSYAPEDVLTGGVLIDKPDAQLITALLDAMVPSNMNLALVSPRFNETTANAHEKYYDFGYLDEAINPELIARLEKASGFGLLPPPELTFVPRKLDLITEGVTVEDGPELLMKTGTVDGWWMGMAEGIHLPKAVVQVKMGFPEDVIESVDDAVLSAMHSRIVSQVLEQPTDMIQTCGLSYSMSAHSDGLALSFSGFDEHMSELVRMVLPKVSAPGEEGNAAFEQARRQLVLDLADKTRLQPYQHAMEAFEVLTIKGRYSRVEMLQAVQDTKRVNLEAYDRFVKKVFATEAHLSMLIAGNIDRPRAKALVEEVAAGLGVDVAAAEKAERFQGALRVVNPSHPLEVRVPNPIENDPNSATVVAYQFGVPNIADRVHLAMLGEFIDRPVFEALRTERQLGYVVFGYVAPHASIVEVRVLVQGFREAPDTVEMLVEETVRNLTKRIETMPSSEIAARKQSLRTQLTKPPSTLGQFAGMYWDQIWEGTHCFRKRALQLAALDATSTSSSKPLVEAWRRAVDPQQGTRKKVAVKLFGAGAAGRPLNTVKVAQLGELTLVDSKNIRESLKNEQYWPHEYICS